MPSERAANDGCLVGVTPLRRRLQVSRRVVTKNVNVVLFGDVKESERERERDLY